MWKQRSIRLALSALGLCLLLATFGCQSPKSNIIRQVDHVLIASSEAEALFSLLSDTFLLPVAWPMANYGRVKSGGVAMGNLNLEVVKMASLSESDASASFAGLAFEPGPLQDSLVALDAREINHGATVPLTTLKSDKTIGTLWTTVMLPDLSKDGMVIFLCEYTHDVAAQRQSLLEALRSDNGGPLTIESVGEIVIGTTDLQGSLAQWQCLLEPSSPISPGFWQLKAGPAIRIIQAKEDGIQALVINVSSLTQARGFLEEQGLLDMDSQGELTMAGSFLQGLTIRLVEKE